MKVKIKHLGCGGFGTIIDCNAPRIFCPFCRERVVYFEENKEVTPTELYDYGYFAHKGNCRFCKERREKELKELVEQNKNK